MKITLVKKILASGEPCGKCADVLERLEASGRLAAIDDIVIADERDPNSIGMRLATRHAVTRAPFFLVENDGEPTRVYTVYFKFMKEVFGGPIDRGAEAIDTLQANPDLDFV